MTYKQIVDEILFERFREAHRGAAKKWVNYRYWRLWSSEPWTFKHGTDDVTVTAGSQTVTSLPADLRSVLSVHDENGYPLTPIQDPADFLSLYQSAVPRTGKPEAYTMIGSALLVGPTSNVTNSVYKLFYEKEYTTLVADGDIPAIPEGAHMMLVFGGMAHGLKLENDPTWQTAEDDYNQALELLREAYLSNVDATGKQVPAYRPC